MVTPLQLLDRYSEELREAFDEALNVIKNDVQIKQIEELLSQTPPNIEEAIKRIAFDEAAFTVFQLTAEQLFQDAGTEAATAFGALVDQSGARFVFRFNARNPEAERWLREHSAEWVRELIDDQRETIRSHLALGMQRGDNPRTVALDVVGRFDRTKRRRVGGVIGLNSQMRGFVANARDELERGDYAAYRQRERRDKRLDRIIARAEREERSLTKGEVRKMTGRYADGLLLLRGFNISRTEALTALNRARYEAAKQLVETGQVDASDITREWDATGDTRTRRSHLALDGQKVGVFEPFISPSGARLLHPGDPTAPAEEIINCRCVVKMNIKFQNRLRR